MIQDMKAAVEKATETRQKIAMFHLQVLQHAEELEGMNAEAVCREIGVPATYATELQKMLGLARLMNEQGLRLTQIP